MICVGNDTKSHLKWILKQWLKRTTQITLKNVSMHRKNCEIFFVCEGTAMKSKSCWVRKVWNGKEIKKSKTPYCESKQKRKWRKIFLKIKTCYGLWWFDWWTSWMRIEIDQARAEIYVDSGESWWRIDASVDVDPFSGTSTSRNIFLYICYNLLNQLIDKKIYKIRRRNAKSETAAGL